MSTLDTLKCQPLIETIDQFAYKFGLMFKSNVGETYTVAMFKKSLPHERRQRLMGVSTFNDVIQRVKEVQQFLGQTIPPTVQWTGYPMGWQYPNSQGMQYPYEIMMPPGPAYPGQTPVAQDGPTPSFLPQEQTQIVGRQPKINFMATKSVSFSPQLETLIGVKNALTEVSGEISALKSQFFKNLDSKVRQIREELKDSSSFRMKDDLQEYLHYQTKVMDRSIEKLIQVMEKYSREKDRHNDGEFRNSHRYSYREQSRSQSRDGYLRSPSRSPGGYIDYRRDRDRDGNRDRDRDKDRDRYRDRDYRKDRSTSRDGYDNPRLRSHSGARYNPNIIYIYCQEKRHIQADCPQLEKDLRMGHLMNKDDLRMNQLKSSQVEESVADAEPEIHARTSIQSAENKWKMC